MMYVFVPFSQMFNSLISLKSQLSLELKWESLKENEKIRRFSISQEKLGTEEKQQQIRILCTE